MLLLLQRHFDGNLLLKCIFGYQIGIVYMNNPWMTMQWRNNALGKIHAYWHDSLSFHSSGGKMKNQKQITLFDYTLSRRWNGSWKVLITKRVSFLRYCSYIALSFTAYLCIKCSSIGRAICAGHHFGSGCATGWGRFNFEYVRRKLTWSFE